MDSKKDALNKEDLYLLLESYKNSVEMNTLISQQLTSISEALNIHKGDMVIIESNLQAKLEMAAANCEKVKEKMETHDKESLKSHSKIFNKINLLYVGIGSIVLSLIGLIIIIVSKNNELIHTITKHLGAQ